MSVQLYAEKEMLRMKSVFEGVKVKDSANKKAEEFKSFAQNYFEDGLYFYKEKKYEESFEAFIISWAYIDICLKLDFFSVPEEHKKWFTA